ncbi:MAG: hypothetical protein OHK0048_22960 [Rhodoferax sp.]
MKTLIGSALLVGALTACSSVTVVEHRERTPLHPVQVINPCTQGGCNQPPLQVVVCNRPWWGWVAGDHGCVYP